MLTTTMRLRELYDELGKAEALLKPLTTKHQDNTTEVQQKPLALGLDIVTALPSMNELTAEALSLRAIPWMNSVGPFVRGPSNEIDNTIGRCLNLVVLIARLRSAMAHALPPIEKEMLSVKLPDDLVSLDGLSRVVGSLIKILDHTSARFVGSRVRFMGVESGSNWIQFAVEGAALAGFLGLLLDTFNQYAEKRALIERHHALTRGLDLDNKAQESALKSAEQLQAALLTKYVGMLVDKAVPTAGTSTPPARDLDAVKLVTLALKELWALTTRNAELRLRLLAEKPGEKSSVASTSPAIAAARDLPRLEAGGEQPDTELAEPPTKPEDKE